VPISPAEPTANPGEPGHQRTTPLPGSTEPAAGWRPREPPLIAVDPAFVLDRWRPADSAALRRFDLDPDTARFFGYTVEQAQAMPGSHYDGDERARLRRAHLACHTGNLASRRVAEKCGFVLLGQQGEEYQFRRDLDPPEPG
jgi:hypothetical protein